MNHDPTAAPVLNASDSISSHDPLLRSRLIWTAIAVLVLLLLVLTPPLLKLNRYARGIALSMSRSLGRPVHLDNVSLGLLPVPHLTLQNVVISEDPAFGNEPTIRANTVEANVRVSSLWRRPMEFSRVRFVEPSVNLVRNADGHWNLEGLLLHAAQVSTAPTAQQHRGNAPRFPYIEATGGRVNVKIGDEKKPFSLTDADFALWLPSPEQWSVRLTGTPARTDINLNDPGVVRLEGSLQRAAHMDQVPVTLQATWRNAPLGEATRLLTGDDQGWRGTVQVDASIRGSLGGSRLATDITLDDLRRADFVPVRTLSLHLRCVALANVPAATLQDLSCNLPAGGAQPLRLQAEHVDLSRITVANATMEAEDAPLEWFASWARLFSVRFPATSLPGTLDATLTRGDAAPQPGITSRPSSDAAALIAPFVQNGELPVPADAISLARQTAPTGWIGSVTLHLPQPTTADTASTPFQPAASSANSPASLPGTDAVGKSTTLRTAASTVGDTGGPRQSVTADVVPGTGGDSWHVTLPPSPVRLSADSVLSFSGTATQRLFAACGGPGYPGHPPLVRRQAPAALRRPSRRVG